MAKVLSVSEVVDSDKLFKTQVDIGGGDTRQVTSSAFTFDGGYCPIASSWIDWTVLCPKCRELLISSARRHYSHYPAIIKHAT